jgi:tRNA(Leu) C34 or U34 (ribose-2'-O)-methylase TrmL
MNKRGYACVGLYKPKDNHNVGGVLRAAGCYDIAMVAASGKRYKRHSSDTMAAHRHLPLIQTEDLLDVIPFDCVPVAIEILPGSKSLIDYTHPERAFYIFGPEDNSVPAKILEKCRDKVSIPTVRCMNLAATVNVVLYDRLAKELRR